MAAVASQRSQQRKPQAVYGKARRNVSHHADFFDDDNDEDELALPAPKPATVRRAHNTPATVTMKTTNVTTATNAKKTAINATKSTTANATDPERGSKVNEEYPLTKPATQSKKDGGLPKKAKLPAKEADTFDVPSSGDEKESAVTFMPVAPKRRARNGLVEDRQEEHMQLAPWERKATRGKAGTRSTTPATERQERSAGSQLQEELAQAKLTERPTLQRGRKSAGNVKADAKRATKDTQPEASLPTLTGLSATERLAQLRARKASSRSAAEHLSPPTSNTAKRAEAASEVTKQPQSKRRRTTPQPERATSDVELGGTDAAKVTDSASSKSRDAQQDGDIFDVPAEDPVQQPTRNAARSAASRTRTAKSRIPPRPSRRTAAQQSVSAPEELTRMLLPDTDIDLPDADDIPSTPPIGTSAQHASTPTPKQTQAWADFFEPVATPSADLAKLDLSDKRRAAQYAGTTRPKAPVRSSSDVPKRRVRMVDRLRAEAVSSSEDGSNDEEDDDEDNDIMIDDKPTTSSTITTKPEICSQKLDDPTPPLSQNHSFSQSYNQTQDKSLTLPESSTTKVTYAKQRSYLAEENLEADILLDAPLSTPQRPPPAARRTTRPSASQSFKPSKASRPTSAFDLDDDDDTPGGGLRSIHELRAGGRNTRLLGEISALLTEISDHTSSARSRRRSALLELATQLLDPTFATESFVGHGFEQHLLAEVGLTASGEKDAVGDFLLASAVMLLLSGDMPAHTAGTFGMALPWLVTLLRITMPIAKAVKDRKANLSRSMQGDVVAFAGKVAGLQTIWGAAEDEKMVEVSTRFISLKTLDLLIGRLRGAGDSSELLDPSSLTLLLPPTTGRAFVPKEVESRLGVSVLEALSTLSATSAWPVEVVGAVAGLPSAFSSLGTRDGEEVMALDKTLAHAKWLAYRLSLNLTNDADLDFSLFVQQGAVEALLKDVVAGFAGMQHPSTTAARPRDADKDAPAAPQADDADALPLDLLVLALGTLINLFEHSGLARRPAIASETGLPLLKSAVEVFKEGREKVAQAQSEQESAWNVAYGYLAVLLAGVCADADGRVAVDGFLSAPAKPDQGQSAASEGGQGEKSEEGGLPMLIQAVRDFVAFHQKVDGMQAQMQAQMVAQQAQAQGQGLGLGGEVSEIGDVSVASVGGGGGVWSAFTERLVGVLGRLERGI